MRSSWLSVFLFFASPAFAEMPVVTRTAGQPIKAVWSNGNEAELKFARSTQIKVSVPYQVTENLCNLRSGDFFKMNVPTRVDQVAWFWSKHSDPTKVGQKLGRMFQGQPIELFTFVLVASGIRWTNPDLVLGLEHDEIEFSNLQWLPGLEDGTLKPFTIREWTSENMVPNSQTQINENRVTSGAYNVHVKPLSGLTAEVEGVDSMFKLIEGEQTHFIFAGNVVNWQWQNAQGPCSITFKTNLGPAVTALIEFISNLKDPFVPYLAEQDSLLKTIRPQFVKEDLQDAY